MKNILLAGLVGLALFGCRAPGPDQGKLYVSNVLNNTVSVLDPAKGEVIKQIPVGGLPHNFAFTPDYKHLFVTNTASQNVSVIDTETDTVVKEILLAPIPDIAPHRKIVKIEQYTSCRTCHQDPRGTHPMGIALAPNGVDLLVTNFKDASLTRLDAKRQQVVERIPVEYELQPSPANLIFSEAKDHVYVVSRDMKKVPGRLTVYNRQFEKLRDLEVIKAPFGMVTSKDGSELYIASRVTNKVEVWDTEAWTLKRTLTTGDGPVGLFLADNGRLYTGNFYTNRPAYVSVMDAQTGEELKRIHGVTDITRMTTDPGRRYLYVANSGANRVQVIDLATDEVIRDIPAGAFPVDVAFKPI